MKADANKSVPLEDESDLAIKMHSFCHVKCRMKPSCRVLHVAPCAWPHAGTSMSTRSDNGITESQINILSFDGFLNTFFPFFSVECKSLRQSSFT